MNKPLESCILTISVWALEKWTQGRQVTVRFHKIHGFSVSVLVVHTGSLVQYTFVKIRRVQSFGTHLFTSIQCVLWKFLYLKGSWWPESPFMRNLCFPGFLHIRFRSKNLNFESILLPLSLNFSNEFLIFLKSGLQGEVGGGGEPDLKLVRWRQSGLLRPAQTQTSHMCPSDPPSMAWRSPLRAYVTQAVPISPILTPPCPLYQISI